MNKFNVGDKVRIKPDHDLLPSDISNGYSKEVVYTVAEIASDRTVKLEGKGLVWSSCFVLVSGRSENTFTLDEATE